MLSRLLPRAVTCVALSCAVSIALGAADSLQPKQLAGPPDDFAMMREIAPDATTIHSKAALLPIQLVGNRDGSYSWTGLLPVAMNSARFLVFAGDDAAWQVELKSPSAAANRSPAALARSSGRTALGIDSASVLWRCSRAPTGRER